MHKQEPLLFTATIAENICYGAKHKTISQMEFVEAAKAANIDDFVLSLLKVGRNVFY